jgi:medium-chain acyl-[acyl-carrier-protein] hydrolase
MTSTAASWIGAAPPEAGFRLFCFPHAGGSTLLYRDWPQHTPDGLAVVPVKLPGREERHREPVPADLDALLDPLLEGLLPYLRRPFGFFGHSMGALVAFEAARRLGLDHLFVSASRAPHLCDGLPRLSDLPWHELIHRLGLLGCGVPEVLADERVVRLVEPVLRADLELCERYRATAGAPLSCPITAFGGTADSETPEHALAAWRHHTIGAFALHRYPGGHFFLRDHRTEILSLIGRAVAGHPSPVAVGGAP